MGLYEPLQPLVHLEVHASLLEKLAQREIKIDALVTYHDPCHAKKTRNIYKEPRELLQNYQLVEMQEPDMCCGFGGVTMQSEKYHLAQKAGDAKATMITKTKAKYVSAECSACRMQITNSLHNAKVDDVVFKNPIELIADAL